MVSTNSLVDQTCRASFSCSFAVLNASLPVPILKSNMGCTTSLPDTPGIRKVMRSSINSVDVQFHFQAAKSISSQAESPLDGAKWH